MFARLLAYAGLIGVLAGCSANGGAGMPDAGASSDAAAPDDGALADAAHVVDGAVRDGAVRDAAVVDGGDTDAMLDGGYDARRTCNDIRSEHAALLGQALMCSPGAAVDTCTAKVERALGCGCQVFVSASFAPALGMLQDEWDAAGCSAICPLVLCPMYSSGLCSSATSMCEGRN
jgi:hypothetical protein